MKERTVEDFSKEEFLCLFSSKDRKIAERQIHDLGQIAKYANILFFESQNKNSRFSKLTNEINNKISGFTGTYGVIDEKRADKVAYHGYKWS